MRVVDTQILGLLDRQELRSRVLYFAKRPVSRGGSAWAHEIDQRKAQSGYLPFTRLGPRAGLQQTRAERLHPCHDNARWRHNIDCHDNGTINDRRYHVIDYHDNDIVDDRR